MEDEAAPSGAVRNLLLVLGVTAVSYGGFQLTARHSDPSTAWRLAISADHAIPFVDWTIYLYSWVYTSMLYPAFVIRSRRLMRQVLVAYAAVYAVALLCFWLFPVTSLGFRPEMASLSDETFTSWGIKLTFFVDPPMNLFPSLHLAIATIAALAAGKARAAYGWLGAGVALGVAVTILTMKQHYIADGVAALVLAFGVWWLTLRRREPDPAPAGWRAVAVYGLFHACIYGSMYVAWLSGLRPWA